MSISALADDLLRLLETRGTAAYGGEAVSQHEHAVQAAMLAESAGAPPALIAAALLHDIGHFLEPDLQGHSEVDAYHEKLGAEYLRQAFPPAVSEPVALHVAAKRYLCAVEPGYRSAISPMSAHTLQLQGGPMSEAEAADFRANPFAEAAMALRRWDDQAKITGQGLTPLAHYRPIITAALSS